MANTLLHPDMITKTALMILHQNLNFVGTIDRQYDNSFANEGAKIGDTLRIRKPPQYTVSSGTAYSAQDIVETQASLQLSNQKHVDFEVTSKELSLDIDSFAKRILEPAMSVLAAQVESDALTMAKDVYQLAGTPGTALVFDAVVDAKKKLTDGLAPMSNRNFLMNTSSCANYIKDTKDLFQDAKAIGRQYREGMVGRASGFDFYENTLLAQQERGTANANYDVNDASFTEGSTTLTVDTGTGTIKAGEVITIAGTNRVHPETKVDTGELMQFVVTADFAGGSGDISISPAPYESGGRQNVTQVPANNADVTVVGTASTNYLQNLAYHRDAFTFATADLHVPSGVDMASRQVYDGISLRFIRDYDVTDDKLKSRVDVLYGYLAQRPELACKVPA